MPDEHPCHHCGEPTRSRKYCSNICSIKGTQAARSQARRKPRKPCEQCGEPVTNSADRIRFCSWACSAAAKVKPRTPCLHCGSTERPTRRARGPFCSWNCYNEDRYTKSGGFARWLREWQDGTESGTTNGKPDWKVRWALVTLRGSRCEECGWDKRNPVTNRVPLHVDHVTGDRTRNRPEDLRLLCPNCHSLTANYQHLNNPITSPIRKNPGRRYRDTWQS